MVVLTWLKENGYSGDIVNAKDAIDVYHVINTVIADNCSDNNIDDMLTVLIVLLMLMPFHPQVLVPDRKLSEGLLTTLAQRPEFSLFRSYLIVWTHKYT